MFFFLSLFSAIAFATASEPPIKQNPLIKNLFIIVVDGVRFDDALGDEDHLYTDNIWNKLRPLGTLCTKFYNTELTHSIPAQMCLLTGVGSTIKNPLSEPVRPAFPTLFEYWKKKAPGNSCYFVSSNSKLEKLAYSDHNEYGKIYGPVFATKTDSSADSGRTKSKTEEDENVFYNRTVPYIVKNHPSFVYLNLRSGKGGEHLVYELDCKLKDKKDGCDGADMVNAYYESIIYFDSIAYDLWGRIQHDEVYKDKSVLIILSDHGRHTDDLTGFGDGCRGCRQLNFLIIGPGIKKDFISKKKHTLLDVCPTVGALFDVPTPFAKGKIMKEILE
jgi:hypothetical protein